MISIMNITKPPPEIAVNRLLASWKKACGNRAMIPIIMIKEIPLPTPLSVMRSPSHKMNMEPAAKISVAGIINAVQLMPVARAPAACILRLIR